MASTKYNFYLREPFEKDQAVISKYKKAGKKSIMVQNKKTHKKEPKYFITGEATIQLSVRVRGKDAKGNTVYKTKLLNTGHRIKPMYWNFEEKEPKIGKEPGLRDNLTAFKKKVEDLFATKAETNEYPTIEEIKSSVAIVPDSAFFDVYQTFLDQYDNKDILKSERGIIRSFEQTRDKIKKKYSYIEFNDIDLRFYDSFVSHLRRQGLNQNTVGRHIKNLKLFMKWSYRRKHHKNRDFQDFEMKSEPVIKFFFNLGELESIIKHKFPEGSKLDRVRDMFIISCFTALRYVDYIELKPQHIQAGTLKKVSAKSGYQLSVPILPEARAIFDKWLRISDGDDIIPYPMKGDRPGISNGKMNVYLKEMAKEIDAIKDVQVSIKKNNKEVWYNKSDYIKTHTGRRSFCSNMHYIGMPAKKIMEASGHSTMGSFEKYVLNDDQGYFEDINGILDAYNAFKKSKKLKKKSKKLRIVS